MVKERIIISVLVVVIASILVLSNVVKAEVTIRLWGMPGKAFEKADNLMADKFMKENPDIKVVYEVFPWEEFLQKVQLGFATGGVSDIVEAWGGFVPSYVKGGHLISVTPAVYTIEEMRNFFFPAALEGITIDGKIWGVPNEICIDTGLNINVSLMEKAGIERYPETWDEVITDAKKLVKFDTKNNMVRAGISFVADICSVAYTFWEFIYKQGGDPWSEDGIHVDLSTPEAKQSATFITDLVLKHRVSSAELETAVGHQMEMFFARQTAIANKGPQIIGKGLSFYPDFKDKVDYIPIPPLQKGGKQVIAGEPGWMWVITKASKHKDAAIRFTKFLGSPENLLTRHLITGHVAPAPYVANNPEALKLRPWFKPLSGMLKYVTLIGPVQDPDKFYTTVTKNLREVIDGKVTIKKALAKVEKEINATIDELR